MQGKVQAPQIQYMVAAFLKSYKNRINIANKCFIISHESTNKLQTMMHLWLHVKNWKHLPRSLTTLKQPKPDATVLSVLHLTSWKNPPLH